MKATNIVLYSVIVEKNSEGLDEHSIRIAGSRLTTRHASDMINAIVEDRISGSYITTYKVILPNINHLKVNVMLE